MGFLDKIGLGADSEKLAQLTVANPRKVFEEVLKQASGSSHIRDVKYDIFYQIIAFYGVVDGVGTSTIVANTALALADTGLSICVVDTSILNPVQDVLLSTNVAVDTDETIENCVDWFDMPYTKNSVLHVSKIKKNISVLSFKGKHRGVVDALSSNDTAVLVELAFSELHNKFDIILVDCCHELTAINTACLQQSQQVIQVWNDSPIVVSNLENFITNAITLSCPLDKMRYVVYSRMCKDVIGSLDPLLKQYRCKHLATNYTSEEISVAIVAGKILYQRVSSDQSIIDFTDCIIKIACHILNIHDESQPNGTITSNDIMDGKVEGTYHNKLKKFNEEIAEEVVIDINPDNTFKVPDKKAKNKHIDSSVADSVLTDDIPIEVEEPKGLFGKKKRNKEG